jgi:hypothetical protein
VDESSSNELVVAVEYTSTVDLLINKVMLVSLTAQPDPDRPFIINGSLAPRARAPFGLCQLTPYGGACGGGGDGGKTYQDVTATPGWHTARVRTKPR